jgi:hypothetical protein
VNGLPVLILLVRLAGLLLSFGTGDARREAAWERLRRESPAFRRAELRFTGVWGTAFVELGEVEGNSSLAGSTHR